MAVSGRGEMKGKMQYVPLLILPTCVVGPQGLEIQHQHPHPLAGRQKAALGAAAGKLELAEPATEKPREVSRPNQTCQRKGSGGEQFILKEEKEKDT